MQVLDWVVLGGFLAIVAGLVLYIKQYVVSVSDYLAGNRMAGRYLLTMAGEMGQIGAISIIAIWESQYFSGWGATWWSVLNMPFWVLMALSGWVIYRYRQTRSLTIAQFFEQRYSRRFRIFAGLLAFVSGTLNYAIFPSVTARFLIYVCGIPECPVLLGPVTISLSYAVIMAFLMGMALWITLRAGQVGIMVTDAIQGAMMMVLFLTIGIYLFRLCGWEQISEAFAAAANQETNSMVNPFKTSKVRDFNIWFYLIGIFGSFYSRLAWQGTSGYNAAAKSPHEARMAGVLGALRQNNIMMIVMFISMVAYTVMHHPDFAGISGAAGERIFSIMNPAVQKQMTVPLIVGTILPVGLLGCFVAVIFSMAITTDDTYLHSWGSIFIQDVVLPLRKKPLSQTGHLKALRWSIFGVALFAYLFSLLFRQTQYILMFMAITGSIFLGGAGACIIGGLYWKRGTTAGAWTALLLGSFLSGGAILLQQVPFAKTVLQIDAPAGSSVLINGMPVSGGTHTLEFWRQEEWQSVRVSIVLPDGREADGTAFYAYGTRPPIVNAPAVQWPAELESIQLSPAPGSHLPLNGSLPSQIFYFIRGINGRVLWLFAMLVSIAGYVLVSLAGRKEYNMDKLLHRKQYATADVPDVSTARGWKAVFLITNEFTRSDKIIYLFTIIWSFGWTFFYLGCIIVNLISVRSDAFWVTIHKWSIYLYGVMAVITLVWFGAGAVRNTIELCFGLKHAKRDETDDGRVE
ncbi:MAG: hypothetical protein WC959_11100 [Kiritimatiellales bacterium]